MLENALKGSIKYWIWLLFLSVIIVAGFYFYLRQLDYGLGITGMSRDISWGLYIAQFIFTDGLAAFAAVIIIPFYLHDNKAFGKITLLGELLAIASTVMCMLFVFVDLGQPSRIINIFLYPSPHSLMFWDVLSLSGYLIINVIIAHAALDAEHKSVEPPKWLKMVAIISIPWAVGINTVAGMLLSGLAGRSFWMTALLAPRFLASAFSAGSALLIILCLVLKRISSFNPGEEVIKKMGFIVTYAMCINVFFTIMEYYTAFYSGIPEHVSHIQYIYSGLGEKTNLPPWMWISTLFTIVSLSFLLISKIRNNNKILFIACAMVFISIWIEKGLSLVVTGFIPTQFGEVIQYLPTFPESMISLGIWAIGIFLLTVFYKITLSVRAEDKS